MAKGRFLFKSISNSIKMIKLPNDTARLLYTWMRAHLNKYGCFYADPQMVKNIVFPRLNIKIEEVAKYLDDMEQLGLIKRFKKNGDVFLWYPEFLETEPYLRKEREGDDEIPAPPKEFLKKPTNQKLFKMPEVKPEPKRKIKYFELSQIKKFKDILFDDQDLMIIEVFYKLGYKCPIGQEKDLAKWLEEISKEYPEINFKEQIKKFKEYWEVPNRTLKTHKLAWRNWLDHVRMYANSKNNK